MRRTPTIFVSVIIGLPAAMSLGGCGAGPEAPTGLSGTRSAGPSPTASATGSTTESGLSLVVIGDSISFNSSEDCPGCTGFVDSGADALGRAVGRAVAVNNRSQHNGLDLPGLMEELPAFEADLRRADAIIIGIAYNSFPLNDAKPCGSEFDEATVTIKDWSKVGPACGEAAARTYRPIYDKLFSTVAGWRSGKPTILLTVNRYNDWVGWQQAHLTATQAASTVNLLDAWNTMQCGSAKRNGFTCADIYHAFNGPDGTRPSGGLLGSDYTHPSQKGNDTIAGVLSHMGFAPLR